MEVDVWSRLFDTNREKASGHFCHEGIPSVFFLLPRTSFSPKCVAGNAPTLSRTVILPTQWTYVSSYLHLRCVKVGAVLSSVFASFFVLAQCCSFAHSSRGATSLHLPIGTSTCFLAEHRCNKLRSVLVSELVGQRPLLKRSAGRS